MTDLSTIDTSDLLTAFINNYNAEQEANEQIINELEKVNTAFYLQSEENKTLKKQLEQQNQDLAKASQGIADAEKLAKVTVTQKNELALLRKQLATTQQQLTALNSANPKKLKAQVERVKAKSEEKDKKITRLTTELSQSNHKLKQANSDKDACKKVVEALRVELDNTKAQGLYHNGDHHLVIWPQKATMLRPDGSEFQGTNLLYLHQSGRGGFITFDPQSDESKLCPSPKGGLRPSAETIDFAHNWLYKVNQVQKGEVEDDDRAPINYNN